MRIFTTKIKAIDPLTGELKTWDGPYIKEISYELADEYCQNNGLRYCEVDGELFQETHLNNENMLGDRLHYQISSLN